MVRGFVFESACWLLPCKVAERKRATAKRARRRAALVEAVALVCVYVAELVVGVGLVF